jgi:large subunit ribosomal protein L16
LLLQPRHFKHKKVHKQRQITYSKLLPQLSIGSCGLLILQPIQLSSKHLSKFKLFLKRAVRKSGKTKRFFWFKAFPHLPLTRKAVGSRMGKGKGKLDL